MKRPAMVVLAGIALIVAVAAVSYAVFGPTPTGPSGPVTLQPDDPRIVAQGRRVYVTHCASCHGADLQGQPDWRAPGPDGLLPAPPHDASGHTWHHPDDTLFRITKFGVAEVAGLKDHKSAMPIYDGVLSDEEIVAALSWIKSRWPAGIRARHDQINQQARAPR